jgi:hypothetical protein
MEFQSYYGSSNLLWNSIAVERISGGSALGRGEIQPARDCTAMEIHSYQGSSHPLRNSIASVNALAGLPMIALPSSPGMRHKTGLFICSATPAGRSGLMPVREECYSYGISQLCPAAVRQGGRGKPQPWSASLPAMEFQSGCKRTRVWSSPLATPRARVSSAACRPQWHEPGGVSARDG